VPFLKAVENSYPADNGEQALQSRLGRSHGMRSVSLFSMRVDKKTDLSKNYTVHNVITLHFNIVTLTRIMPCFVMNKCMAILSQLTLGLPFGLAASELTLLGGRPRLP